MLLLCYVFESLSGIQQCMLPEGAQDSSYCKSTLETGANLPVIIVHR